MGSAHPPSSLPGLTLPWGETTGEAAFQAWSETVATIFDLDADRETIADFRFGFSAWHLGSLVLGLSQSDAIRFARRSQTIARSSIDHYLVQVYHDGSLVAETEGETVEVQPGDVWILDLAREATIHETRFRSTNLAIPRNLLAPLLKDPDGLHGLKLAKGSPMGDMLSRYLEDLGRQAPRMTLAEAASIAESTIHLVAGCAGPGHEARSITRNGFAVASLASIRRYIDAQLHNPALDADLICREFALSRATLYRLCEPLGGVQAHIRRRRLARCFKELVTPSQNVARISQIAFRWGFSDEATFSRAFRAMYGLSPSDARTEGYRCFAQMMLGSQNGQAEERDLGRWILDLMKL